MKGNGDLVMAIFDLDFDSALQERASHSRAPLPLIRCLPRLVRVRFVRCAIVPIPADHAALSSLSLVRFGH